MEMETMEDFYLKELKDVADAQRQLLKALPKMAKAAQTEELRQAFEIHERETQEQLQRVERILKNHGESGPGPRCKGMQGIISEGEEFYFILAGYAGRQDCIMCAAAIPVPSEKNIIKIISADLCR